MNTEQLDLLAERPELKRVFQRIEEKLLFFGSEEETRKFYARVSEKTRDELTVWLTAEVLRGR